MLPARAKSWVQPPHLPQLSPQHCPPDTWAEAPGQPALHEEDTGLMNTKQCQLIRHSFTDVPEMPVLCLLESECVKK